MTAKYLLIALVFAILSSNTKNDSFESTFEKHFNAEQLSTLSNIDNAFEKLLDENFENGEKLSNENKTSKLLAFLSEENRRLIFRKVLTEDELLELKEEMVENGLWKDIVSIKTTQTEEEIIIIDGGNGPIKIEKELKFNLYGKYFSAVQEMGLSNKIAENYYEAAGNMVFVTSRQLAKGLIHDIEKYGYNDFVVKRILGVNLVINELLMME